MSTVVAVIKEFIATPEYHKGNLKFVFEGIPKTGSIDSTWVPTKRNKSLYALPRKEYATRHKG